MTRLRFLSAGESHGPRLNGVLDGIPAGLVLDPDAISTMMGRRQKGYGAGGRMKIERDTVVLSGGYMGGQTTGGPLALEVGNRDWASWAERDVAPMTKPRPGHADLTAAVKYGYTDLRLALERASARETAMRVGAGAICVQLLAQFGIRVGGWVRRIGQVEVPACQDAGRSPDAETLAQFMRAAHDDEMASPDPSADAALRAEVKRAILARDTLGGVLEVAVLGLPPGLGSHVQWDRKLEGRLAMALMSIQAMKGVEIGPAFDNASRMGTDVHDGISAGADGAITRDTNHAGGLEGGITTGEPLLVRIAMKPISTTLTPRHTVDLANGETAQTEYERSDICATPRAVPICEAMVALVLADALLEKLGGDSIAEMKPRFDALRRSHLNDLAMDNVPWRIGYQS
ncbi:MAG: chorismate synthase [Myxococcales bacterium]|nr:chorismate synthase [Myxococcales bacterium]